MSIPKEVLDALEEWRSAHKAAQEVIAQIMDGKRTGGALSHTRKANEAILKLSNAIEKHKVSLIDLFPEREGRDQYKRFLFVGKFYERRVLKKE
jgi:hypothetical protein